MTTASMGQRSHPESRGTAIRSEQTTGHNWVQSHVRTDMKDKLTLRTALFLLLGLLHLPMLWVYYSRLWQQEHYQFFPFALGAFAWFVFGRAKSDFRIGGLGVSLAVTDVALVVAGTLFLNSPWLVCLGFVCWCFVLATGLEDREMESSLGYLVLLPLLTLRLPLAWDLTVIQWLQRVTTAVASLILNDLGFLHLRQGNVIEFPGKRFLVADACSGVQSLFTLLFLGALIASGYRRKWAHSVFVLICAACFAGLMNVVRVIVIAIAWDSYQLDLATGWPHDAVGYLALVIAALLVLSADAFVFFMFSPVPDVRGRGITAMYRNPFVVFWNWCFLIRRRLTKEEMDNLEITNPDEIQTDRSMPELREYIRPSNHFSWLFGFLEHWSFSRNLGAVQLSIPFLVFGIGGAAFVWWLQTSPHNDVVDRYEEAVVEALNSDDKETQRIYLETLLQLRPKDQRYRLQHVLNLVEDDEIERAVPHIQMLTSKTSIEYAPAHRWLASQAMKPDPAFPRDPSQIERHLLRAVELKPFDVESRRLLATVLSARGQFRMAEQHLADVIDKDKSVALDLARLKIVLKRPQDSVHQMAELATSHFSNEVKKDPLNAAARVSLAKALTISEELKEAEQTLIEGIDKRTPEVAGALSQFYVDLASRRMKESYLNREHAGELTEQALKFDPENISALEVAVSLDRFAVSVSPEALNPAVDALFARRDELDGDRQVLMISGMALAGRNKEALELVDPIIDEMPELHLLQVRLCLRSGQSERAAELIQALVDERPDLDGSDDAVAQTIDAAEALTLVLRLDESLSLLEPLEQQKEVLSPANLRRYQLLRSRLRIGQFDQRQAEFPGTGVRLLEDAMQEGGDVGAVIDRLVRLSFDDLKESSYAKEVLTAILSAGRMNASVYAMIGSQAMLKDKVEEARRYLERAYSMSSEDPMILNNLALALVRGDSNGADAARAMDLVEHALRILPDHPDVLSTRAEVHISIEDWVNARRDLEVALKDRPNSVRCRQLLGMVCDAQGEPELAKEHRRRASELLKSKPATSATKVN